MPGGSWASNCTSPRIRCANSPFGNQLAVACRERSAVLHIHMYYAIGWAGHSGGPDISWSSSTVGAVSCTACVLSHRMGGPQQPSGHQLAVVAYSGDPKDQRTKRE